VQMRTGIHQVTGRLHGLRAANMTQNVSHSVCMRQHAFSGIEHFACKQRFGKGPGARQRRLRQAHTG